MGLFIASFKKNPSHISISFIKIAHNRVIQCVSFIAVHQHRSCYRMYRRMQAFEKRQSCRGRCGDKRNDLYIKIILKKALWTNELVSTTTPCWTLVDTAIKLWAGFQKCLQWCQYLLVLTIKLVSCHPSGVHNFEVALRFLYIENFGIPASGLNKMR